ncbi:MAG: O-antigen ligase family protein [Bacteroidota bacterium]
MPDKSIFRVTGSEKLKRWYLIPLFLGPAYVLAGVITKMGIPIGGALIVLPGVFGFMYFLFQYPVIGVWGSFCLSFIAAGLSRYVPIPWGLFLDGLLTLGWIALLFKNFKFTDWSPLNNGLMLVCCAWFGLILLEIVNPDAKSIVAWFYAMRTIGLQTLMMFGLIFMLMRHVKDYRRMLNVMIWFSIAGALWGMKQKFLFLDGAENRWLNTGENGNTHILFGVLRAFSFYSDAGQFGASMAMMTLVAGILALGPYKITKQIWYGALSVLFLIGFGISGTRGALAVPAVGGLVYLIMRRNFTILLLGCAVGGGMFGILAYTTAFQSIEPVRRMRTAMDPDNPSLQSRLRNQRTYRRYLSTRPIGAGIGSAGYWGKRFSPWTIPARTPTDSYFVRIWAETGFIGLMLNIYFMGYFMGKVGNDIWSIRDPVLKNQTMAIFCGAAGIIASSYGNQVFSSFPTSMIMNAFMPLCWMVPLYDQQLLEEKEKQGLIQDGKTS